VREAFNQEKPFGKIHHKGAAQQSHNRKITTEASFG
jgi:hypothetical protein